MTPMFLLVIAFFGALASDGRRDVQIQAGLRDSIAVRLAGAPEQIWFESLPINIGVSLHVLDPKLVDVHPSEWQSAVVFRVTDAATSDAVNVKPVPVWQSVETIRQHDGVVSHFVEGTFRLEPLALGRYKLTVSYDGAETTTAWQVVRGDETAEVEDRRIQLEIAKADKWESVKRLQFRRLELNPENVMALWELGQSAERHAEIQETTEYYQRALTILHGRADDDSLKFAHLIEEVVKLLPRYYSDRTNLVIDKVHLGGPVVQLIDKRTGKPVRDRVNR